MSNRRQYVIITPVRNEADFVAKTIESVAAQTLLPQRWVIVDDGSSDGTAEIVESARHRHEWLTIVRRPDRGFRKTGGGVVEAFYDGYEALRNVEWEFVVKLDGDLSFEPGYFEKCLAQFADDPRLGIGGGTIYVMKEGRPQIDSPGDPPFHVRGATKIYRKGCWQQVHPLVAAPGWDTIDEVTANMHGWQTRTFGDIPIVQHRETGASDGEWATWFKNGLANYITGYHPAFMFAKCVKRLRGNPHLVAPAGLWAGFCSGYLRRQPYAANASAVRYLQQQQMRRLMGRSSIYRSAR